MKKDTEAAGLTVAAAWFIISMFQFGIGMFEEDINCLTSHVKRIEILFPAYRIGRWIMKDLR